MSSILESSIQARLPAAEERPSAIIETMTSTQFVLVALVSLGVVLAWWHLMGLSRRLAQTTLLPAGRWCLAAAALWTVTWALDIAGRQLSTALSDHLWYASAVLSLCAPMSVLGSRRPGTRVWTWFILIPMLFALGWPVMTLWLQGSDVRGLQLETPQLAGYLLVLVMGAGNYFGTRFTIAGLLFVAGNSLLVISTSSAGAGILPDRWWARLLATGCMVLAVLTCARGATSASLGQSPFDRLWLDFFDQFGVVWGRRIQDRVNFIADKERWPARLELHGFEWKSAPDVATQARIEHTFRWLLRRFVDPPWIDRRLGTSHSGEECSPLGADS